MRKTWVWSLDWEDPLEKGKATHSSILAWRIPFDCIVHGVTKSQIRLNDFHFWISFPFVRWHEILWTKKKKRYFYKVSCAVYTQLLSLVWTFTILWTIVCQAPLSMGFYMQEYWSGLPFLSPGDLLDGGIKPRSPAGSLLHWSWILYRMSQKGSPLKRCDCT